MVYNINAKWGGVVWSNCFLKIFLLSIFYDRKMENEIKKAINNTVFKEYGKADHSKLTKAINLAQEHVSKQIIKALFMDLN